MAKKWCFTYDFGGVTVIGGLRTGSIEVVITNEKSQTKSTGTSAAAAAAAFSMADRIRRLSSDAIR